jgi:hypothetical protein
LWSQEGVWYVPKRRQHDRIWSDQAYERGFSRKETEDLLIEYIPQATYYQGQEPAGDGGVDGRHAGRLVLVYSTLRCTK